MSKPLALLIEDEALLREAVLEILTMETNMDIEVFSDGQAAADRLQGTPANVVFLDLHLPKVSGIELLNRIRADQRWNETQVVIMTADYGSAQQANAADYILMKPIDIDAILDMVAKLNL